MTDYTSLEILKGSLSHLPDDELNSIVTAVQKEQDARKNKKRQELINKAVAALHDLQAECGFDGCLIDNLCGCGGTVLGIGMEGEDDRVSCLKTDQRFENRCGCRVCDRGDAGDDSDRFRHILKAFDRILVNDADGFLIAHMIDHIFARKEILCRFVLKDASACLLNRKFCEGAMLIKGGDGTLRNDVVDLFLIV